MPFGHKMAAILSDYSSVKLNSLFFFSYIVLKNFFLVEYAG